jgi:hypothetical protein
MCQNSHESLLNLLDLSRARGGGHTGGQKEDKEVDDRYTANEGPGKILYKCLVPIYVFPEMKLFFPKPNYNFL